MGERVLVIGKGGREHALAYRLSKDAHRKNVRDVLIAPGNDGASFSVPCLRPDSDDNFGILKLARNIKPNLIVIGPEEPLALGLTDMLTAEGFTVFGPTKRASQIESSKSFMKGVATAASIPTAAYQKFSTLPEALRFLESTRYPTVVKADGLCAGKGVVVAQNIGEARSAAVQHIANGPIVIEEFLDGIEMSVIGLCTKNDVRLFAPVADHKRLLDGDKGPNTGGMGVVGPLPLPSIHDFLSQVKEKVFLPALSQMSKIGSPFQGALFAGLMVSGTDIRLLEFNARFGDPETQALMVGIDTDLFPILLDIAKGESIAQYREDLLSNMQPTSAITMAAMGYPAEPRNGDAIEIGAQCSQIGTVFFSGVSRAANGGLVTNGGRTLTCVAREETLLGAIKKSYDMVSNISFRGAHYRTDIGRSFY